MKSEREIILEVARSIREGLWRLAYLVQDAAESLDARIEEEEDLDGREVREVLERLQALGALR